MSTAAAALGAAPRAELGRYDTLLVDWRVPIFGTKAALAGLASILLAFRFHLDDPQWALLTVFVTMAPQAGHVAAKGLARIVATLVGGVAALVLIGLFAQAPLLFLFGLSLWLALCTFAARSYRNYIAYAWVLAGFTASIVGIGASDMPDQAFDIAVARVSEIILGVGCAFFFSAIALPERLGAELLVVVQATRRDFVTYLHEILLPDTERVPVREARRQLMGGLIASDTIRSVVAFEEPPTAGYGAALAALNATLARAVVTAHTLDMQLRALRLALPAASRPTFAQVLNDALATIDRLPVWFGTSDRALATADTFARAAERADAQSHGADDALAIVHYRLGRLFAWLAAYARASAAVLGRRDLLRDLPRTAFTPFRHFGLGLLGALRVMIIVPAAGLFWLYSGTPANSGILVICSVFVAFMATVRHPDLALRGILLGFC
ncbi:MAG: FUSC family protein, partial [Geminicoccaceae bacterium]